VPPTPPSRQKIYSVVILMADRLYADLLGGKIRAAFPEAAYPITVRVRDAQTLLAGKPVDLMISGLSLPDSDVTELLALERASRPFRRVVVVAPLLQDWISICSVVSAWTPSSIRRARTMPRSTPHY
jgi:hypothetical protein